MFVRRAALPDGRARFDDTLPDSVPLPRDGEAGVGCDSHSHRRELNRASAIALAAEPGPAARHGR
jgi:hypothetical protein